MSSNNSTKGRGENPWNRGKLNNVAQSAKKSAEEKFRNTQEKLQASIQKHLEEQAYESSSSEEELESESILTSVFKNYDRFSNKHEGIERTQQFLENLFQSGAGICLICIGSIKRTTPVRFY